MKLKKIFASVMILAVLLTAVFCTTALAANDPAESETAVAAVDPQAQVTSTKAIACAIIIAVGAGAGALAMSMSSGKASDAIARQPESAGNVRTSLMLTLVFIETAIIYALLVVILVIFVL